MRINWQINHSFFYKIVNFILVDRSSSPLGSLILRKLSFFDNYIASLTCLMLSVACFWYKIPLSRFEFIGNYKLWLIFLILSFIFCEKKKLLLARATLYIILFLFSVTLSGLLACIGGLELGMVMVGIVSLLPFIIAFLVASTYDNKILILNLLLILSLPLLLTSIWQFFNVGVTSMEWVSQGENLIKVRASGLLENPNAMGSLSMLTTTIALTLGLTERRWYYFVYTSLSLVVLILTFSRSAWFGLLSGILLVLVIKNWKIIFVSPILLIGLLSSQIRQRLFTIFSASYATDSAIDGRLWAGNNMIELFCNLPFFGVGAGTYGTQNSIYFNSPIYLRGLQNGFYPFNPADSQWLQILAQTGVVGSLFLLLFFVSLFIYNLRSFLQTNSYIFLGLIATIAALVVNGLFENILSFGVIAITAGAIMGIGINYGQKNCNSL